MSEYQDLINQLAKALPEREDLLEQVNQLVEKYEQQATPRFVIPIDAGDLVQSHQAGMYSFLEQDNMKVSDQKNTSLKGQNKRLKKILRFIVNEL
ncbi:hypothetical protein [Priestia megaterium]|uniref:hypothetical protein n=1 Tax=Priestia megaterium TaxID=1404 RepID=UPI002E1CC24B|nr:hypothetical protein [Priestia megaterium]